MNELSKYFVVFGVGFAVSLILTRVMIWLGPRLGMIDMPDERRIHKTPIPRAGGVAVFLAFNFAAVCLYAYIWPWTFTGRLDEQWWLSFLAASSILCAVGIWDDIKGTSPIIKLGGQIAASCVLFFLSGKGFDHMLGIDFPWFINLILTIVWCVALINAFNLIDGLDGLCGGLAIISSLGIGAAFLLRAEPADSLIVLALIGSVLGFLRYNFHPARIFLGDTGSMFLGFALASLALESAGKSTVLVSIGVPFLAAGVPIMDTILAIWRRSARRLTAKLGGGEEGPKIMGADKEHLHHRLLEAGFSQRKVAVILYMGNLLLVAIGLFSIFMSKALVGLFLIVFISGVYVVVRHVVHVEIWDTGRLLAEGIKRPGRAVIGMIVYPVCDLIWLSISLVAAMLLQYPAMMGLGVGEWAQLLPVWISPVFLMLVLGHTYSRVWSRSNFRDYLILFFSLTVGVLLTFAFLSAADADLKTENLRISIMFAYFSMFGIFGVRVITQTLREWMMISALNERAASRYVVRHILLYGAGNRGALYLRELRLVHPDEMATRKIIGFIDDDVNLRRRFVHGVRVLGHLEELEDILGSHDIDEIVITADLLEVNESRIREITARRGVLLSLWSTVTDEIMHETHEGQQEPQKPSIPK
ncbi:hypothetical protein [Cerasicoccus arenae]|uniref:Undecaprenyl/decaprenyl-phosphate alpha-N-acetylglucosaminyl 1-phosphate transferase n=1 Tax=Cerasicoccus arenae TaxID=424488 RepID=A0A8J3DCK9_9BACT|nr:hypothetical protein [Cerasicoccus arenae]MBK1858658.1 hypothetical protein [Cerasicoccus arenae]GHC04754.1 hypothetical protein GCM10007047_21950 [Cerasicoccus arenae]